MYVNFCVIFWVKIIKTTKFKYHNYLILLCNLTILSTLTLLVTSTTHVFCLFFFCRKRQVSDCTNICIYLCFNGVKYSEEESISFLKHTHKLYVRTLLTASATQGCGTEAKFSLSRHTFEAASRENLLIPEPTSTSSTQSSKYVLLVTLACQSKSGSKKHCS